MLLPLENPGHLHGGAEKEHNAGQMGELGSGQGNSSSHRLTGSSVFHTGEQSNGWDLPYSPRLP